MLGRFFRSDNLQPRFLLTNEWSWKTLQQRERSIDPVEAESKRMSRFHYFYCVMENQVDCRLSGGWRVKSDEAMVVITPATITRKKILEEGLSF
jgi:hypothetical protein